MWFWGDFDGFKVILVGLRCVWDNFGLVWVVSWWFWGNSGWFWGNPERVWGISRCFEVILSVLG